MRDPWKVLAGVLGVCLLSVWIWRPSAPDQVVPAAGGDTFELAPNIGEASGTATVDGLDFIPQREVAADPHSPSGRITLLVRLLHDGAVLERVGCQLRAADGTLIQGQSISGVVLYRELLPGDYSILAICRGYFDLHESLRLLPAPALQEHEITMEPSAKIPVKFMTPSGERLFVVLRRDHGVIEPYLAIPAIFATGEDGLPPLPLMEADELSSRLAIWDGAGFLTNPDEPDGWLAPRIPPPFLLHAMIRNVPIASRSLGNLTESVDWILEPSAVLAALGSIRVRVLDPATGAPVEGGRVYLETDRSFIGLVRGENGWYERHHVPSGVYPLRGAFGKRLIRAQVEVLPGVVTILHDVRPMEPMTSEIRVLDLHGTPAPGVQLLFHSVGSEPRLIGSSFHAVTTSEQAMVTTRPLLPGAYVGAALPTLESGWAAARFELQVPAASATEIQLHPGRVVVLTTTDPPAASNFLCLLVEGRAPLLPWRSSQLPARVRLAPGEHACVLLDAGGAEIRRVRFEVTMEADELRVEVPLP